MAPTAHVAADLHAETYRWSRDVYDRAVAAGVFGPEDRIELIDGELLTMTPQGSRHAAIATRVGEALARTLGPHGHVRTQMPLAAGGDSEPEPDLAVVPGDALDYLAAHPSGALLVVEVSDDSLHRDRTVKQRLYARCRIPEYWIVSRRTLASRSTAVPRATRTATSCSCVPARRLRRSPRRPGPFPWPTCFLDRLARRARRRRREVTCRPRPPLDLPAAPP